MIKLGKIKKLKENFLDTKKRWETVKYLIFGIFNLQVLRLARL